MFKNLNNDGVKKCQSMNINVMTAIRALNFLLWAVQHRNVHHVTVRTSHDSCQHVDLFQNHLDRPVKLRLNQLVHLPVAVALLPTVLHAGLDKII